jgi:hypothetical protein
MLADTGFGSDSTVGKSLVTCTEAEELQPLRIPTSSSAAMDFIAVLLNNFFNIILIPLIKAV